ncbi:hypothetical protein OV079_03210 [Nannocystis pusilla]|uniref:Uncharacterized protein n=1 Tax=Nannocystis pusilla TaxID=889268 RepID=A0A9X3EI86_9BACT|nr:hypothetical protein [Nannocystis pusilla]MCY1004594.1 hypothetical protein [Nannocystis pusilla]
MLACPRLVLAAAIAASPVTPTRADSTCPNERADAGADANLGNCLGDAREARRANEPRLAAAAYARALMFAREAYAAGKQEAAADWYVAAGEQIVHYGTEGCALASNLPDEAQRAMLTACAELLDEFLADLEAVNAGTSRSAAAARQRRAELEPLLAGLPAPPQPEEPPLARPTEPRGESIPAPPKPMLPLRRPTGLDAGLGVSAAVAGLAIAGLVVGDGLGRKAHAAALSGPGRPMPRPVWISARRRRRRSDATTCGRRDGCSSRAGSPWASRWRQRRCSPGCASAMPAAHASLLRGAARVRASRSISERVDDGTARDLSSRPCGPELSSRPSGPDLSSRPSGPELSSRPSGPESA